ncbi:MAG: DUF3800 domain-containing protein [Oscillospiraceae bacterium]|nr:DUF3800 domain-containing protein [Oscillospiraceae bacterium]
MNIFVYSDESGVFDKGHNKTFVYGGLVFLSKDDKDVACRKYIHAENAVRQSGTFSRKEELKAAAISPGDKRKLFRSLNDYYKFGVVVDQKRVRDSIMANKKSKQRYLDYVFKIGVKRLLQRLILEGVIHPRGIENIYFFVDEHTTATNGVYELRESLEEEFKYGIHNINFSTFYPPLFPQMGSVHLKYCNSATTTLVRAADIIANRIYHDVLEEAPLKPFDNETHRMLITKLP